MGTEVCGYRVKGENEGIQLNKGVWSEQGYCSL